MGEIKRDDKNMTVEVEVVVDNVRMQENSSCTKQHVTLQIENKHYERVQSHASMMRDVFKSKYSGPRDQLYCFQVIVEERGKNIGQCENGNGVYYSKESAK